MFLSFYCLTDTMPFFFITPNLRCLKLLSSLIGNVVFTMIYIYVLPFTSVVLKFTFAQVYTVGINTRVFFFLRQKLELISSVLLRFIFAQVNVGRITWATKGEEQEAAKKEFI